MMPPADRIPQEPDHSLATSTSKYDWADDFLAVGPAVRILQLNIEGLLAAKHSIISTIADRQHIDVICLQETHIDVDPSSCFSIGGFDLISINGNGGCRQ